MDPFTLAVTFPLRSPMVTNDLGAFFHLRSVLYVDNDHDHPTQSRGEPEK